MCGIVGIFSVDGRYRCTEGELSTMRDTMALRGPDSAGLLLHDKDGLFLGLGHRRLSIIDLSPMGHQPMTTADGTLTIVFNGEIFNFRELREKLDRTEKYVFRSRSDTEVILYAVKEWGLDGCLKALRGMYAFALFDWTERALTLVRDPLGVKPLYFFHDRGMIAFASEIKALATMPGFQKELDEVALYHYLTFANSPLPRTFFKGVRKLEPGSYLRMDRNVNGRSFRYWDPGRFVPGDVQVDERECADEVRRLLRVAVQRRMVSDVPFGVFLSGGIDSSLNVALMAESMDRPVQTYSIGVHGDPTNEFVYARKVAQLFGTSHHEVEIGNDEFLSFIPQMVYLQDEPLADPVCVPIYYVSKLARDCGTVVVQVGEGSDEIFAGYDLYHSFSRWDRQWYQPYCQLPRCFRALIQRIVGPFIAAHTADALRRAVNDEPLFIGNAVAFWDYEKQNLFRKSIECKSSSRLVHDFNGIPEGINYLDRIIQVELRNRLPELLLMRVDKMTMGRSVEARVPFLDEDLVEFALRIPSALKSRGGVSKYILKKAAEGILPEEVIYRKKWGFCGSATTILTPSLVAHARAKIFKSSLTANLFSTEYLDKLFGEAERQHRFTNFKIWNLLNLVSWHEHWFHA